MASWLDKVAPSRSSALAGHGVGNVARHTVEGAVVGASLGAAMSRFGTLDVKVGAKQRAIPVDLGVAIAGVAASLLLDDSRFSKDFSNAGVAAATIYAFRTSERVLTNLRLRPNPVAMTGGQVAQQMGAKSTVHGDYEMGADPILTAVEGL